jgi:hypothetical protein
MGLTGALLAREGRRLASNGSLLPVARLVGAEAKGGHLHNVFLLERIPRAATTHWLKLEGWVQSDRGCRNTDEAERCPACSSRNHLQGVQLDPLASGRPGELPRQGSHPLCTTPLQSGARTDNDDITFTFAKVTTRRACIERECRASSLPNNTRENDNGQLAQ